MLWTRHQLKPSVPHPFPAAYDQAVPRFREGGGLFLEGDLNRGGVIIFEGGCVFTKNVTSHREHDIHQNFLQTFFLLKKMTGKDFLSDRKDLVMVTFAMLVCQLKITFST